MPASTHASQDCANSASKSLAGVASSITTAGLDLFRSSSHLLTVRMSSVLALRLRLFHGFGKRAFRKADITRNTSYKFKFSCKNEGNAGKPTCCTESLSLCDSRMYSYLQAVSISWDGRSEKSHSAFKTDGACFFIWKNFGAAFAQDAPGRGGTSVSTGEGDRKKKAQTRTASTTLPRASHYRDRLQ